MNAFLTGSRVYGTPREDSDIDLAVLVSPQELQVLCSLRSEDELPPEAYEGVTSYSLRFGKLNLLCVTTPEDLAVWREGTDELIARKPVTRDEAVAVFKAKRWALQNQRNTAGLKALMAELDESTEGYEPIPEILTDEDRAALKSLGDDFIPRLIERAKS